MKFKTKKNNTFIVVALFFLSLTIKAQPVLDHLTGREINCNVKGTPLDHYWSKLSILPPQVSEIKIFKIMLGEMAKSNSISIYEIAMSRNFAHQLR